MATAPYGGVRDMRALAQRVHQRWLEYRRRNPGMSVPIGDTLSRILEHAPDYRPPRKRAEVRQRPPLQNPGIFTMKEIASALRTTVGDLLAEPGRIAVRDAVSPADRRKLRDAVALLRSLFDLDDEALAPAGDEATPFAIAPAEFLARDYDYPEPLHAWIVPSATLDQASLQSIREVRDERFRVVRALTDSFAPEIASGAKLIIDTVETNPRDGAIVAAYIPGEGAVLRRAPEREGAFVWGTVTAVVEHPPAS